MIDWTGVVGFDWDAGDERRSVDNHRVRRTEAEQAFFNQPLLVLEDERHSSDERRFHALGCTEAGMRLHITFTLRREGARVRVISARDMSARARCFWVYAGTGPPRLLPPCGGGPRRGSRRPARQASGGAFDNLPGQGDPPPRPAVR